MSEERHISVIIPNYNGSATIGKCLEAAFSSAYGNFEVIVVDDCSSDNSVEIIKAFPCTLIRLETHGGTSKARNAGALHAKGDILFFTDADCLPAEDAFARANLAVSSNGPDTVVGGTYTRMPHDRDFFSIFQSVFVNHSEMRPPGRPDYVATHAMAIDAATFRKSGGFPEDSPLPILEDVEFSHKLSRSGFRLVMDPGILVTHIFNFSLRKSLRNAVRKTKYWIMYSLGNRDLFADSGTASAELKINGAVYLLNLLLPALCLVTGNTGFLAAIPVLVALDVFVSRGLLAAFARTGGAGFAVLATLYYTMLYPAAVWAGACAGFAEYFFKRKIEN